MPTSSLSLFKLYCHIYDGVNYDYVYISLRIWIEKNRQEANAARLPDSA